METESLSLENRIISVLPETRMAFSVKDLQLKSDVMTRLESEIVSVKKPAKEVFDWLCNLNNYEKLMPEQVEDWVSTEQDCSFSIKGMASLGMELREKMPDKQITFVRKGKAPFDFTLFCNVTETGPEQTELQLVFDADMNPFLKMMAEKPLTSFLNILVRKYRELTIS